MQELCEVNRNYVWLNRYVNPENWRAHYRYTAPTLLRQFPRSTIWSSVSLVIMRTGCQASPSVLDLSEDIGDVAAAFALHLSNPGFGLLGAGTGGLGVDADTRVAHRRCHLVAVAADIEDGTLAD